MPVLACSLKEVTMTDRSFTAQASSTSAAQVLAASIPVAHTPPGGYGDTMPPPVLAACNEPLAEGAPDLRGTWAAVSV